MAQYIIVTYETRRVVVTDGFGVAVRLKHRVSLHNLILKRSLLLHDTYKHAHSQSVNSPLYVQCAAEKLSPKVFLVIL